MKACAMRSLLTLPFAPRTEPHNDDEGKASTIMRGRARGNDFDHSSTAARGFMNARSHDQKLRRAATRSWFGLCCVTNWKKRVYDDATRLAIMRNRFRQEARSRNLQSITRHHVCAIVPKLMKRAERALATSKARCFNRSSRNHKMDLQPTFDRVVARGKKRCLSSSR